MTSAYFTAKSDFSENIAEKLWNNTSISITSRNQCRHTGLYLSVDYWCSQFQHTIIMIRSVFSLLIQIEFFFNRNGNFKHSNFCTFSGHQIALLFAGFHCKPSSPFSIGEVEKSCCDAWREGRGVPSPDVGDGGGVAATRWRCFSSMDSKIAGGEVVKQQIL